MAWSRKRTLWALSFLAMCTAILAALSPHPHLCPWFARVPWIASTCPSRVPLEARAAPADVVETVAAAVEKDSKVLPPPDIAALPIITRKELALHDGVHDADAYPIWLAIDGVVLDVSGPEGQRFYAQGQDYAVFAGTDSTRALALGTLDDADVARGDDVSDFNDWQQKELNGRILFYLEKYPAVGKLAPNSGKLTSLLLASDEAKEVGKGFRL